MQVQNLEIISINIWHILISLCNLVLLFLILKKLLYGPVRKAIAQRQAALDKQYADAQQTQDRANANEQAWKEKLQDADVQAAEVLGAARQNAARRADEIVADAKAQADDIVNQARADAELERRKSEDGIRHEIVDVSALLTEKLLEREIKESDHRAWISSFLDEIGEQDDRNQ
ncbi:MAG: F0F1 ATP synthase subunit B [Oscillospiraceae bacterium]|nr:F0F1 ATP synthase subunit B [Oscillospiraceae bacterium]